MLRKISAALEREHLFHVSKGSSVIEQMTFYLKVSFQLQLYNLSLSDDVNPVGAPHQTSTPSHPFPTDPVPFTFYICDVVKYFIQKNISRCRNPTQNLSASEDWTTLVHQPGRVAPPNSP